MIVLPAYVIILLVLRRKSKKGYKKNRLNFLTSRSKITTRESIQGRRSSVVEQLIRNQQVVSSILTAGSSKILTNQPIGCVCLIESRSAGGKILPR